MSEVRAFSWDTPVDTTRCWAKWREDLPCPNRATYRVQNRANQGYSLMCDVHKDGFAHDYPFAAVQYLAIPDVEETL
jgi:hypothetical protein